MANTAHGQNGKYIRSLESAERDTRAAQLRSRGVGLQEIADELGYTDASGAWKAIKRALAAVPVAAVSELRAVEASKLDAMERAAWSVLLRRRPVVAASGKIAIDPDTGKPLVDDTPTLQAVNTLLRVQERRARLMGLDAPARVEMRATDELDREIEELIAGLFTARINELPAAADNDAE